MTTTRRRHPITQGIPAHPHGHLFDRALVTALRDLPMLRRTLAPEHQHGYAITRKVTPTGQTTYRVYNRDAVTPRAGTVVAVIDMDGTITLT